MKKLTATASKLHTVFSIAEKVLMALAIAAIVCAALIGVGFLLGLDPDTVATGYESIDIGYLELQIADRFGPDKWVVTNASRSFTWRRSVAPTSSSSSR